MENAEGFVFLHFPCFKYLAKDELTLLVTRVIIFYKCIYLRL